MANSGNLSRKQERAIVALLTRPTVQEAARAAQVGERTLYRWLKDDDTFQMALRIARHESLTQAIGQLQRQTGAAVAALARIMGDQEAAPSAQVSAAKAILELAFKSYEIEEVEARIAALERRLNDG